MSAVDVGYPVSVEVLCREIHKPFPRLVKTEVPILTPLVRSRPARD